MSSFGIMDMREYMRWSDGTQYGYDMKNTILKFKAFIVPQYRWTYNQWLFNEDIE